MPIAHVSLPVSDLKASKAFYASTLAPLGYTLFTEIGDICVGFAPRFGAPDFWPRQCPDQKTNGSTSFPKTHIAFQGSSKKAVHDFYEAALKAGGTCNGPPGERPQYTKGYYAAFVLDLDGNNVECLSFQCFWFRALQQAPKILGVAAVGLAWWAGRNGWMMG
ncbi:hypothetical protein MMC30_003571 [Trapelia coarctata]|nr:hypothetical protein [Trapelia coarctata]